MAPLRGNVGLRDLGITSLPGERERSRSPRDDNNPDDAGPARPRIGNTHVRAPQEREVRPRLRALRWLLKKPSSEEKIEEKKIEEEKKSEDPEEDSHQGGPALPWELDQYKVPPMLRNKNKDEWDWSQPGWAIRAHGKPRKRKFHPIHREFPLDAAQLESRRITVKLHTGTSPLGIRSVVEDSWTAHQERKRTSQMQPWRGYTFFRTKVRKEQNSGGRSTRNRARASTSVDARAIGSGGGEVHHGYARGSSEKRGKDAGPVWTFPEMETFEDRRPQGVFRDEESDKRASSLDSSNWDVV